MARRAKESRRSYRSACASALAVVAHASALVLVIGGPGRGAPTPATAPVELSILVDDPPSAVPPAPHDPAPQPSALAQGPPSPARVRDGRLLALGSPRADESAMRDPTPEPNEPAASLGGETAWSPSWTVPATMDLGLDGGVAWRPSAARQGEQGLPGAGMGVADPAMLRSALDEGDRARGLGKGGPVLAAVHEAEQAIGAVGAGAATIEVTTDTTGRVVSVRVMDFSSDERLWAEAASAIGASLRGRTIAVPRGARGMAIAVHVEVAMRTASGALVGRPVTPLAESEGVGLGFDVADIGSRPRVAVHARVVSERRL